MAEKILIVDDEKLIRWSLGEALFGWGFIPVEAENVKQALELFDTESPAVILLDINLPDGSSLDVMREIRKRQADAVVVMITPNLLVDDTIATLRAGAYDFIGKPISFDELQITIRNGIEAKRLRKEVNQMHRARIRTFSFDQVIGDSPAMLEMKSLARKVAESDVSGVLLQGESGTGKDFVAKAIHYSSSRAHGPFVAINCAATPSTLIESELLGYEKGAFTDSRSGKEGLFEQAEGGTVFFDEIGELELSLQAKLLQVLEEGTFRRVGGFKDLPLDVRVMAASVRDLKADTENGLFRLDLFYRLSIIQIDIPALRERGDDVLKLADHFIDKLDKTRRGPRPRKLSRETADALRKYHWTGNVGELRNAIERALMLDEGNEISLKHMPRDLAYEAVPPGEGGTFGETRAGRCVSLPPEGIPLEDVEMALISQALARSRGNITKAGELLGISRDRVRYRLKKRSAGNGN